MNNFGPAVALAILLSAGFVHPVVATAPPQQATTQTPTEPLAPKPSAAVQQILDELRTHYRQRLEKIRSENRGPTPSERSELSKSQVEFYDRALALARATGDAAGEATALQFHCARLDDQELLKNPGGPEAAATACLETAAAWKRAGDGPGQILNLSWAAEALFPQKPAEAERLYLQVLELGRAEALRPLAAAKILQSVNYDLGHRPERLKFLEAALAIQEEHNPGDVTGVSYTSMKKREGSLQPQLPKNPALLAPATP